MLSDSNNFYSANNTEYLSKTAGTGKKSLHQVTRNHPDTIETKTNIKHKRRSLNHYINIKKKSKKRKPTEKVADYKNYFLSLNQ